MPILKKMTKFLIILQVKHNLENEVVNMEMEIVKLRAELEGDSDLEEPQISADENAAEDEACYEHSVGTVSQDKLSGLCQKSACQQEQMHGLLELRNVGNDWSLQHEVARRAPQTSEVISAFVTGIPSADDDVISCRSLSQVNETVVSPRSAHLPSTQKGAMTNYVQEDWTSYEAEDWPELAASTVKMLSEGVMLPHTTGDEKSVSENMLAGCTSLVDDGGVSAEGPADVFISAVTQAVMPSHGKSDSNVSVIPVFDVGGDELTVNTSCIQSAHTASPDHDTVCAIQDSFDEFSAACDADDDTNSCVSGDSIVVPDSEDDLFCSPQSGHVDSAALTSDGDVSEHVNETVAVSDTLSDGRDQSNTAHAPADCRVGSLAENVQQELRSSEEKYGNHNADDSLPQCNRVSSQTNLVCVHDADSADIIRPTDCLSEESHSSTIDETLDAGVELHRAPLSSVVQEQFPKRPHWTLVVSGISPALDQVVFRSVDSRFC